MTWGEILKKVADGERVVIACPPEGLTLERLKELDAAGFKVSNWLRHPEVARSFKSIEATAAFDFFGRQNVAKGAIPWPTGKKIDRIYEDVDSVLYKILLEK